MGFFFKKNIFLPTSKMASNTEFYQTTKNSLTRTRLGNTNSDRENASACNKKRVFAVTINEASLPHYNEIKDYILNLKSLDYMLTIQHFNQKRIHYHMLIKFKNMVRLSTKKMFGSHIETSHKGFINIYKYITCQDAKHKLKGVTFKIIDEIDKCDLNMNTKKYENYNEQDVIKHDESDEIHWISHADSDDESDRKEFIVYIINKFINSNKFYYQIGGIVLTNDMLNGPMIYDYDGLLTSNPRKIIKHDTNVIRDLYTFEPKK